MFNFFKKGSSSNKKEISIISLACLLVHAARIDENYTIQEKNIIKDTLIKLGFDKENINDIITKAEMEEKDSNHILKFTSEAKNLDYEKKVIILEALWSIIYSDENEDMYESNLMRRLSGLLYLDKKIVGDIKEKFKKK